jgi:hypothetical protein
METRLHRLNEDHSPRPKGTMHTSPGHPKGALGLPHTKPCVLKERRIGSSRPSMPIAPLCSVPLERIALFQTYPGVAPRAGMRRSFGTHPVAAFPKMRTEWISNPSSPNPHPITHRISSTAGQTPPKSPPPHQTQSPHLSSFLETRLHQRVGGK